MITIGHEMIMASAGSGKTYALTSRYIRLIALGAPPDRIVALTFTRKAAGEFFDEILTKLAHAASDPALATELARNLGLGPITAAQFGALLRTIVDAMPRLALATFDAFFARIVRSFPLELGLGGDFTLLEDYAARFERRRVLRELFACSRGEPDEAQREFIEAFKRATFGREEKRLARLLDEYIDDHQHDYLAAPDADLWGNASRIWPEGCRWLEPADSAPALAVLRAWLAAAKLPVKSRERWAGFLTALETWAPGVNPAREVEYVLKKLLAAWSDVERGQAILEFDRRRQDLSPEGYAALRTITQSMFAGEYHRRLAATRGIHGVLARYDASYEALVRRSGRLTFADVERLLRGVDVAGAAAAAEVTSNKFQVPREQPRTAKGRGRRKAAVETPGQLTLELDTWNVELPAAGGETSSRESTTAERRLLLDWRLDGKFDHWLLDEFQDTSRGQWEVLRNLIDEVVQDASQARTFFCVGDVKQAIYNWRGGDARLFREILDYYNAGGASDAITLTPMDESHRSGPAVLELVNRVFGDALALADLSPETGARWSRDWRPHTSAVPDRIGQAAWLQGEEEPDRFQRTFEILQEIQPLERGLSVAVLTQRNDTAAQIADFLRREGRLAAVAEADQPVCIDNPATAAVLALFKAAAHPGDSLAWAHARMTPLGAALTAENLTTPDALTDHVLRQVHTDGFEAAVEWWWRRLEPGIAADDAFTHGRGRQLAEAARRFDDTGSRDVAEFLQFAERHVVREAESAGVIRVMTIHKAKGLGFDLVILPDLDARQHLGTRRKGLAVHRNDDQSVAWVLDLPNTIFREQDPTLAAHVRDEEAEASYEKIAVLYVALTRAKHAMYLITSSRDASWRNYPHLLAATLGGTTGEIAIGSLRLPGAFSAGDPQWFASMRRAVPPARLPPPVAIDPQAASLVRRFVPHNPSDQRIGTVTGASLFAPGAADAADIGLAVHAALAAVTWWRTTDAAVWEQRMRANGLPDEAIALARACLDAPALASVFVRSSAAIAVDVWCERGFEFVHEGAWITGRFDRVIVERNAAGAATRVRVIDFKTDRLDHGTQKIAVLAERYRPQVSLYRRAAAMLAGVSESRVGCELVFIRASEAGPVVVA